MRKRSLVAQVVAKGDPRHARIEVLRVRGRDNEPDTLYISGYRDGQLGERSIGMAPEVAAALGALLVGVLRDSADQKQRLSDTSVRAAKARGSVARSTRSRNVGRIRPAMVSA